MPLYPLKFMPIYKPKVWGGRTLKEKFGRTLPGGPDERIGESWEIADLGETTPGGGGGDPERSLIAQCLFKGQTLHDLLDRLGRVIMGDAPLTEQKAFPLLIKLLDARENLSVQVHPSPEYAEQHPDAHVKHEAWYVLDAEPGAVIYKGVKEGVSAQQFREAIEANALEPLLLKTPVEPGECHYLPSGTCHALGAGIIVAEVQTPSDTTFRVYDWGRSGRERHVEQALQCMHFGPVEAGEYQPGTKIERNNTTVETLVRCEPFRIEKITSTEADERPLGTKGQPRIWIVLSGGGRLTCKNSGCDEVRFAPVETLLLPADMDRPRVEVEPGTSWLEVTFPQAMADTIA